VNSWIQLLENDPREILRAASDVEKILTHLQVPERTYEVLPQIEKTQEQDKSPALAKLERADRNESLRRPRAQKDRSKAQSLSR
jgi:putative DNA primase/helicase